MLIFGRIHQILNITKIGKKRKEEKKIPVQTLFKNQFLSKNRKKFHFKNKKQNLKKKNFIYRYMSRYR